MKNNRNPRATSSGDSPDVPTNSSENPPLHRDEGASHCTARLPASMIIGPNTSQRQMRATFATVAPPGTSGESVSDEEVFIGPLFVEWVVARHMFLTRDDLTITDDRPGVYSVLSLETSGSSGAMSAEMQAL